MFLNSPYRLTDGPPEMQQQKPRSLTQTISLLLFDSKSNKYPTVSLLLVSFLIRLILVVYSSWQDRNFDVKYTDVDYFVFTDAARYIYQVSTYIT